MPEPTVDHIIEAQRDTLKKHRAAFDAECDRILTDAKKKLDALAPDDAPARKLILADEKKLLQKALAALTGDINKSTRAMRKKLEEIDAKLEAEPFDLEGELKEL